LCAVNHTHFPQVGNEFIFKCFSSMPSIIPIPALSCEGNRLRDQVNI
jgi:hypothetical protein